MVKEATRSWTVRKGSMEKCIRLTADKLHRASKQTQADPLNPFLQQVQHEARIELQELQEIEY